MEGSLTELNALLAQYPDLEDTIVRALQEGDLTTLESEHIATVRRMVGKVKAAPYADLLKAELDAGADKRLVFVYHDEPLEYVEARLRRYGYDVAVLTGGNAGEGKGCCGPEVQARP